MTSDTEAFKALFPGRPTSEEEQEARLAAAWLKRQEIEACGLCDYYGYRNGALVCDHVDRTEIAAAGMAKVQRALIKAQARRNQPPATVTNIGDKA